MLSEDCLIIECKIKVTIACEVKEACNYKSVSGILAKVNNKVIILHSCVMHISSCVSMDQNGIKISRSIDRINIISNAEYICITAVITLEVVIACTAVENI